MRVNVPDKEIAHFWEEPPDGSWEFWSFRFEPECKVGDDIVFFHCNRPIAKAVVAKIERPGQSACDRTGRFRSGWKVFWQPESFIDLQSQLF